MIGTFLCFSRGVWLVGRSDDCRPAIFLRHHAKLLLQCVLAHPSLIMKETSAFSECAGTVVCLEHRYGTVRATRRLFVFRVARPNEAPEDMSLLNKILVTHLMVSLLKVVLVNCMLDSVSFYQVKVNVFCLGVPREVTRMMRSLREVGR